MLRAFLLLIVASSVVVQGQTGYISLMGDQFYDEYGQPFVPNVMNFYFDLYSPVAPLDSLNPDMSSVRLGRYVFHNDFHVDPEYDYGVNDGVESILQDMREIKTMGFNTLRVLGIATMKHWNETGYRLVVKRHPVPWDNTIVHMNPPYSPDPLVNPVSALYFDAILQVCSLANTLDLKVALEPAGGNATLFCAVGDLHNADHVAFYKAFSQFIHDNQVHNLLAYDLWGEPTLADRKYDAHPVPRTKAVICELAGTYNDAVRSHDPDHLTTIGGGYLMDVLKRGWDPMLLPLDFLSVHAYPTPDVYEYIENGTYLESTTERYLFEFANYHKYLRKPYAIFETGFAGENPDSPPNSSSSPNPFINFPTSTYGDEQAQADFFASTYPAIMGSRCAGYGNWCFHNMWVTEPNADNTDPTSSNYIDMPAFKERYFGLLRFGAADASPAPGTTGWEAHRKLAAQQFVDWTVTPPAPAELPAIPAVVDMDSRYYNPHGHPYTSVTYNPPNGDPTRYGTVTGHVQDQFGQAIAGAVVTVGYFIGVLPGTMPPEYIYYSTNTFTDENGDFEIRAMDRLPNNWIIFDQPGHEQTFEHIELGAFASSWEERGWEGGPIAEQATYELNSFQHRFDVVLDNVTVWPTESEVFEALATLTAINVDIGGEAQLKARYEVHLEPGFHAVAGSECHIHTKPVHLDCAEIDAVVQKSAPAQPPSIPPVRKALEAERVIGVQFHFKEPGVWLEVSPNPSASTIWIKLHVADVLVVSPWPITVLNTQGQVVLTEIGTTAAHPLDVTSLAPGNYTLQVVLAGEKLTHKFIRP